MYSVQDARVFVDGESIELTNLYLEQTRRIFELEELSLLNNNSLKNCTEQLRVQQHVNVALKDSISEFMEDPSQFLSSWKTLGFYSNVGFGSAISANIKKVLDYVLLNRTCEKWNRWFTNRQNENPEEYKKWYNPHKPHCMKNHSGSSQSMEPEAAKDNLE